MQNPECSDIYLHVTGIAGLWDTTLGKTTYHTSSCARLEDETDIFTLLVVRETKPKLQSVDAENCKSSSYFTSTLPINECLLYVDRCYQQE